MTSFIDDDGSELDYDGKDFGTTKQALNVHQLQIKGDFSVNFKIPYSSKNKVVLNYFGENQSDGRLAGTRMSLVQDGNVQSKGILYIVREIDKELEVMYISGNSNWVKLFDFSCRDIRTTRYSFTWNGTNTRSRLTNTEGIVFPMVDFLTERRRADPYFLNQTNNANISGTGKNLFDLYPCAYVHTLVKELANHAGIKITGNLLNDPLYKLLVITPDRADVELKQGYSLLDGRINSYGVSGVGASISLEDVVPSMKAIELLKWLIVSFGVVPSWNDSTETLTLTLSNSISTTDSQDWSNYYVSHILDYSKYAQHNYVNYKDNANDEIISRYNELNATKYACADIESAKTDESTKTPYTAPFQSLHDDVSDTVLKWCTPYVPFVTLEDDEAFTYTSVSNNGSGKARFNGTGFPFGSFNNFFVRIDDSAKVANYHGIIQGNAISTSTSTRFDSQADFLINSSGTLYTQSVRFNNGPFIFVVDPNINYSIPFPGSQIAVGQTTVTDITRGYFARTVKPNTTAYKTFGISYGEITLPGAIARPLTSGKMKEFARSIKEPIVKSKMLIPTNVYKSFNFDSWVYIKTEKLQGHFFVNNIQNYVSSDIPVTVELVRI